MIWNDTQTEIEELLLVDELEDVGNRAMLIVYNDDHNTFDWVIKCFMEICSHTSEQAEQLALIIHFKGKATVKTGTQKELKPFKDSLTEKGLSAVIEEEKVEQ